MKRLDYRLISFIDKPKRRTNRLSFKGVKLKIMKDIHSSNPRDHTSNIQYEMQKLVNHLKKDIQKIDEPQAKALFETSAEVITGLIKAFEHYSQKSEKAWQ